MLRAAALVAALMQALPAVEPLPPIRYGEWHDTGLRISYGHPLVMPDGTVEYWFDAGLGEHDGVVGLPGPSLDRLRHPKARYFDAQVVQGYAAHRPQRATPIISRSSVARLRDGSYLCLSAIGPAYAGGSSELFPAVFVSASGDTGSWRHRGAPAGEPAAWLAERRAAAKRIRCEGGTIIQLPDGRLRAWLHGYGAKLAVADAPHPDGPWVFQRDADGAIIDVLAGIDGGFLFPYVNQLGDRYLVTGGDTWPPRAILGAISDDGLNFQPLAGPLITPAHIRSGATSMKTLRWAQAEDGTLHVAANVWDPETRDYPVLVTTAQVVNPE